MAAEKTPIERAAAATRDLEVGLDHALFECGYHHGYLERRSGRVAALQCAILQRLQRIAVERSPSAAIDAGSERIGIVGGQADECDDIAIPRIEHHRSAVEAQRPERILRRLLDVVVNRQPQLMAFDRVRFADRVELAAEAVDDDLSLAVNPRQQLVVRMLDSRVADDVAAPESREPFLLKLPFGDFANVAEGVGAKLPGRVVPARCLLHHDT